MVFLAAEHVAQLELLDELDGTGIHLVEFSLFEQAFLEEVPAALELVDGHLHFVVAVDPRLEVLDFFIWACASLGCSQKSGTWVRSSSSSIWISCCRCRDSGEGRRGVWRYL